MRVAVIHNKTLEDSEPFIRAHIESLPAEVKLIYGLPPQFDGRDLIRPSLGTAVRLGLRFLQGLRPARGWERWALTCAYLAGFDQIKPDIALIEYGTLGALAHDACRRARVPFVVHFHGHDTSRIETLDKFGDDYRKMFQDAAGIVAVSQPMRDKLIDLGAPANRVHLNPYGVDCSDDGTVGHNDTAPVLLAVGRMVEKKAPHLTLLAFYNALAEVPDAQLRIIGDGPLLPICQDLAENLHVQDKVVFLGRQGHEVVFQELSRARAFVQHSIEASDGDCEGTPVAILEASAAGIPVIATKHAGIPEAVIDGETGFLVDERDVASMSQRMIEVCRSPELAATLGTHARRHIRQHYSLQKSIGNLNSILEQCLS